MRPNLGYTAYEKATIRSWKCNLPTTTEPREFTIYFIPTGYYDREGSSLYECRLESNDGHSLVVDRKVSL